MSKEQNKNTGDIGEQLASEYLERKGYDILARNYRCSAGEIDLVARLGNTLVLVEVKTKTTIAYGLPEEMVDSEKIQKIKNIADHLLSRWRGNVEPFVRIDVVSVILDGMAGAEIKHIENFDNE